MAYILVSRTYTCIDIIHNREACYVPPRLTAGQPFVPMVPPRTPPGLTRHPTPPARAHCSPDSALRRRVLSGSEPPGGVPPLAMTYSDFENKFEIKLTVFLHALKANERPGPSVAQAGKKCDAMLAPVGLRGGAPWAHRPSCSRAAANDVTPNLAVQLLRYVQGLMKR